MKNQMIPALLLSVSVLLSGCAGAAGNAQTVASVTEVPRSTEPAAETVTAAAEEEEIFSSRDFDASYSEEESVSILLTGSEIVCDSSAVEISGTTATIQKEGTYLLSGTLENGSVIVDVEKTEKVQLVLKGVSINSSDFTPIYVRQADKVFITLADNTENSLSNGGSFVSEEEANVDAAVFSREDLTLNGSGTLSISSPGGHGIVSKDSLRITGGIFVIDAASHGLSGKDEVSISDGSFNISSGKDGIHSENSEDATGGAVYLAGGSYEITAGGDGISASGFCRILEGEYTIITGGGSENARQSTSGPSFSGGQRGMNRPMDSAVGAIQELPGNSQTSRGKGGKGGMSGMNMDRGNPQQAAPAEETEDSSTKGIKANSLSIEGGRIAVDAADDGIHANGNLTIQGGILEIAAGDDGIHADERAAITAGSVTITTSYEGIEGLHVEISGGNVTLTASDDGLNAAGGTDSSGFGGRGDTFAQSGDTPSILLSGGTVKIRASGDGIDANGILEMSGGTVIVCGPTQGDTSVLDYNISGVITGGTFLGTGASSMAQSFSSGAQGVISVKVGTCSAGTEITLTDNSGNLLLSHTPELDFEMVILSSPDLRTGESYTLNIGGERATVTAK